MDCYCSYGNESSFYPLQKRARGTRAASAACGDSDPSPSFRSEQCPVSTVSSAGEKIGRQNPAQAHRPPPATSDRVCADILIISIGDSAAKIQRVGTLPVCGYTQRKIIFVQKIKQLIICIVPESEIYKKLLVTTLRLLTMEFSVPPTPKIWHYLVRGNNIAKKAESLVNIDVAKPRDTCQSGRSSILLRCQRI